MADQGDQKYTSSGRNVLLLRTYYIPPMCCIVGITANILKLKEGVMREKNYYRDATRLRNQDCLGVSSFFLYAEINRVSGKNQLRRRERERRDRERERERE